MTHESAAEISIAEQRQLLREWLERKTHGAPIRFSETHVSILGMTEDRVWKLKKAIRFPFVDLSTPELRRRNAVREVALNRRFSPDVYLGVVPIEDECGVPREVAVEMLRMPEDRRLSVVASGPTVEARACIARIAAALEEIHRGARRAADIDAVAGRDALIALWERNLDEMRALSGSGVDTELLTRVGEGAHAYLAGRGEVFSRRIADGRICDGHGDLLADDVFCLTDGPRFLDCLEFDDQLRYGDVLADVAFLAMDLERLGHRGLAEYLLTEYRSRSGDSWPASLVDFYVAYRALVRSKVAYLAIRSAGDDAYRTGGALLALAAEHLARGRVRLVLIGGPPASGKTTLARALAARTGWPVVHSDEMRKRLAGLEPTTSAADAVDSGLYAPEWTARTYDALVEEAARLLARGESVILDASWADAGRRDDAARLARSSVSAASSFALSVPDEVAVGRAQAREQARTDASDATSAVTKVLQARFAPWPDAVQLDAMQPTDVLVAAVLDRVGYPR